jgi:hypothetical protein
MMGDFVQKDNTGALFRNKSKEDGDSRPDYTGTATVDGAKLELSAWIKESKTGTKYMALTFRPPRGA